MHFANFPILLLDQPINFKLTLSFKKHSLATTILIGTLIILYILQLITLTLSTLTILRDTRDHMDMHTLLDDPTPGTQHRWYTVHLAWLEMMATFMKPC